MTGNRTPLGRSGIDRPAAPPESIFRIQGAWPPDAGRSFAFAGPLELTEALPQTYPNTKDSPGGLGLVLHALYRSKGHAVRLSGGPGWSATLGAIIREAKGVSPP